MVARTMPDSLTTAPEGCWPGPQPQTAPLPYLHCEFVGREEAIDRVPQVTQHRDIARDH